MPAVSLVHRSRYFIPFHTPIVYECFMLFSIATYIGCSPFYCHHYYDFINSLSSKAVAKFTTIFGPNHVVYNIHLFSHIFSFVNRYGCLDNFSCFPFESYLGSLKRLIHGPQPPAIQLGRRLIEHAAIRDLVPIEIHDDVGVPLKRRQNNTSHEVVLGGVLFSSKFPNNFALVDGAPALIKRISREAVSFQRFLMVSSFYNTVLDSREIFILRCSQLHDNIYTLPLSPINCKYFCIPCSDDMIMIPIVHTMRHFE